MGSGGVHWSPVDRPQPLTRGSKCLFHTQPHTCESRNRHRTLHRTTGEVAPAHIGYVWLSCGGVAKQCPCPLLCTKRGVLCPGQAPARHDARARVAVHGTQAKSKVIGSFVTACCKHRTWVRYTRSRRERRADSDIASGHAKLLSSRFSRVCDSSLGRSPTAPAARPSLPG